MKTLTAQEWATIQGVLDTAADLFTDVYPVKEGEWADYKMVQEGRLEALRSAISAHDTVTGNGDLWV